MQQKILSCQLIKAIRDAVRKEARDLEVPKKAGYIKISLIPSTREADGMLGGFSDILGLEQIEDEDVASYEYAYALYPSLGFSSTETSSYAIAYVKKRKLISGGESDGTTDCVYSWNDYLEITVRVSGADDKNKALAESAYDVINAFFAEGSPEYSVKTT